MNPNNYFDKTNKEFIAIIDGSDPNFNQPQRANPRHSLQTSNQALIASGLEPYCAIYVPEHDFRQEGWRVHVSYQGDDKSKWRDPKQPFIYRVRDGVHWDRGANLPVGEGPKPELSCNIDLLGCEFQNGFAIANVKLKANLILTNCIFLSPDDKKLPRDLNIYNTQLKELYVRKLRKVDMEVINEKIQSPINKIELTDLIAEKVVLSGLRVNELIIRGKGGSIKELEVYDCEIGSIKISDTVFGNINISSVRVTNEILFNASINNISLIGNGILSEKINKISSVLIYLQDQNNRSECYIERADIGRLQIKGRVDNKMHINECKVGTLDFDYLTNVGELRLHNIEINSKLVIAHSVMGKAVLSNLEWSKHAYVQVIESLLIDMVLMSTVFPKDLRGKTKDDYREIHSTLRQLKYISNQTGNRIQELAYEAQEMIAYQKDKRTPKSWGDKIVLWTNGFTNNHGQSWLQPLGLLLLITAVMFVTIKYTLGYTIIWGVYSSSDLKNVFGI